MRLEMQSQRLESLRPIIDVLLPPPARAVYESYLLEECIRDGVFPNKMECAVSNIGVGPALAVEVSILSPTQVFETYAAGALAKESGSFTIRLIQQKERGADQSGRVDSSLVASYADLYGRKWKSRRDLSFDVDKGVIKHGHLIVTRLEGSHDS